MNQTFDALNRFIERGTRFLVVSHLNPDGDAIGSTLAMGYALRKLGKEVTMVNESPVPDKFLFLPGADEIRLPEEVDGMFDTVIALDCADRARIGTAVNLFAESARVANVDHHVTNDLFGDVNVVVPRAAATAEILFDWIDGGAVDWDDALAGTVYTGLLTDTGGFRYSNATPAVFRKAAKLVETGAHAHRIADLVLETLTMEQIRLIRIALSSLQRSEDGKIAWIRLRREDFEQSGQSRQDVDGIVNYARNIIGVDVGILIRESDAGSVKVSLRSRERVDVGKIAKELGGGGHARAAGFTARGTLDEVEQMILQHVRAELGRDGQ
ncbi:DHH family phosphoesterase [Staphylospora marina]|uniref:DHH family phosphoesterase n=1 Tax=Staphylospora marina TaxID=2490858 RepID=UPI000F5C03A3|nr:bifunctional oligoribonuclease/PAP phosphatase NrnA [Staphylospora marina]